ncbi:MAG: hypothetical protein KJ737_10920 [Proteobacteria bacterium]|nr:hypothetical protein [Pseudomonadota bacterium]
MAKLSKQRLIFGMFLLVLIVAAEIVLAHLKFPAWPAFMVMIFFFESHMDIKKAPSILVGGAVGILCILLTKYFIMAVAPALGVEVSKLLIICLIVYAIVAFGEILPIVFNNYAFMYFLVSGIAVKVLDPAPNLFLWIGIELVVGVIFIAGIIGIGKIMAKMGPPPTDQPGH